VIRPLRMVGLDLSGAATAIAATHDPQGVPFLSVYTVPDTEGRDLHTQIARIEAKVRLSCGWQSGIWQSQKPDLVIIEGSFSRVGGSDYPLHALHGNVRQWLWRKRIPYVEVAPSTVKLWATGSGATSGVNKVTKDKVVAAIIATYGRLITINPRDDNQTDAVALLTLGLAKYGQPLAPYGKLNAAAFKSPKWPDLAAEAPR
jgi:crossover junction endodeoxyribonuclease RuvC